MTPTASPPRAQPVEDAYALSPIQEGMLFHCLLEPDSGLYLTQLSCELEPLDAPAFERAWAALYARHTALRTAFAWKRSERPLQVVGRRVSLPWRHVDWRGLDARAQREALERELAQDARLPFELNRAPLARFALFRLTAERYAFVWTHHHLLIDGWSLPVILTELGELYAAELEGRAASLAQARPFRELIEWLERQDPRRTEAYWRAELAGLSEPTPLVVDRPRAVAAAELNADLTVALAASATRALEELARRHQLTLSTLAAAAWAVLLERYSGRADVLFGVTVSGRPPELPEVELRVGNFINTLPLRPRVEPARAFLAWASRLQERMAELREHSHSPLVEVQGWSELPRSQRLFESIFFFQNFPLGDRDGRQRLGAGGGALAISRLAIREATDYPLIVVVAPRSELIIRLEFLPARFDRTTVARLAGHLLNLLRGVLEHPSSTIQDLPLLGLAERHQLRYEWNDSAAAHPRGETFLELLRASAERWGDAPAVIDGRSQRTYRQLLERAELLGARLAGLGVGPETLVALWLERGVCFVELVLGCFAAGAAYLPLDPQHPPARHRQILARAGARWVVAADDRRDDLVAALELLTASERPRVLAQGELEALPAVTAPAFGRADLAGGSSLAYVLFTSGSTGAPKGAMVDQRGMINHLWAKISDLGLGHGDKVAQNASPCFDISVWQMLAALVIGGETHVVEDEIAQDPLALLERVELSGVTVLELVPSLLRAIVEALEAGGRRPQLAALRWLVPTGEALPPDLVERFGALYPRVRWINAYGPTECSDDVTHAFVQPRAASSRVTIGRPVSNLRLVVRDRRGHLLPIGVPGELWVTGLGVGRGYRFEPRRTAEVFWPDEQGWGLRAYRTGDLARWLPDGEIDFLGRLDHQVKIRGHRIELGEIEARLREHPQVEDCVVLAREEGTGASLVAYVVERGVASAPAALAEAEQVEGWRAIFEEAYAEGAVSSLDAGVNLRVWVSSYSGQPLPEAEIFECFEDSVARLAAFTPQDVLEIGCGTGLLLLRLAPACRSYVGTDLSAAALASVERRAVAAGLAGLRLLERGAHDFSGLPTAAYDLVVLNEVVQYFPSVEYLARVLEGALAHVKPGGCLFVGGVRSLALLEAFHASVQLHRADDDEEVAALARRVRQLEQQEKELLVDPRLFHELARRRPEVRGVWIEAKGGRHDNELTKFRYDVWLQVGGAEAPPSSLAGLEWVPGTTDLASVAAQLRRAPQGLRLNDVPNARVELDLAVVEALSHPAPGQRVADLRRELGERQRNGVAPTALWQLGAELGFEAHVGWATSGAPGCLDVVFVPAGSGPLASAARALVPVGTPAYRSWAPLGNRPLARESAADPRAALPAELRSFLEDRLPAWMVPSAWLSLPALPLTANGKIDRKALPDPVPEALAVGAYRPPRGPVEELLTDLFASVLGLPRVGVEDDFFALGGHSLKATQVTSRLRQTLGVELPLRTLFEAPTPASLAAVLAREGRAEGAVAEAPIPRLEDGRRAPLSFAQERLWFIDQLQPGTAVYNMPVFYRAHGRLVLRALAQALTTIVARHEALRTVYREEGGRAVQQVEPVAAFALRHVDLSALPPAERERAVEQASNELVRRPFDLGHELPLRAVLLRLAREDHQLTIVTHHIAFDGSLHVFARELVSLYGSALEGRQAVLPPLTLQYRDFAAWQRGWLQGEVEQRLLGYWTERLADQPPALELPVDRPRPAVLTTAGTTQLFRLARSVAAQARALARREGVTLFMIALAVFKTLLHRLSGQRDLSVGSPVLDRPRAELEPLIGCFVNTVVLRTHLEPQASFQQLLRAVRETSLGAYGHQELPFEALVHALQPERSLRHTALFQVMFVLLNASALATDLELPGLSLAQPKSDRRTARFDLLLAVWEGDEELTGTVEYRTDLFDRTTILRLLAAYERLFLAALADPRTALARLPLVSPAERQQLTVEWNDTAEPYDRQVCLHELFLATATRQPEAIATAGPDEAWSYGALAARVRALASYLRARGARPGHFVGICLERGPRLVEALLATVASGAAYAPMEPAFPAARLEWILEALDVRLLLTETALLSRLSSLATAARLDEAVALDQEPWAGAEAADSDRPERARADSNDLAYVIFTSGSTGVPKGVIVRHEPVVNLLGWVNREFGVGPGDRLLFTTSPCFDLSVYDVFGVLAAGGTVRVAAAAEMAEPERLVEVLVREGITFWNSAPAALQRLVPLFATAGAPFPASPLRLIFLSGDWIPLALPARLVEAFPGARVISLGGATEATVWSNVFPVGELAPHWLSVPYGRPIPNARYVVLDGSLEPCPIGVPGDLYIGGECLASGYFAAATLTASKFVPDPAARSPGDRLYRTGDRARFFADGNLEFLGRLDHQVKIRGYRIELGEIESVLAEDPRVADAVVLAREDLPGGKALVAYVVAREAAGVAPNDLRESLRERLPDYMVPAAVVLLPVLPTTANGKLDRKALPAPAELAREDEAVLPRSAPEQVLAALFGAVLEVDSVGVFDDFFELGGHSLLATQLLARIREVFPVELSLRQLFEAPTVAGLAAVLASALEAGSALDEPALVPVTRDRLLPLSFAQERLWFLDRLEPGSAAYSLPFALELVGEVDQEALGAALSRVVARHEALRSRFVETTDGPRQCVGPAAAVSLVAQDLGRLSATELEREAAAWLVAAAGQRFDLEQGPLFALHWLRLTPTRHWLVVNLHHIVSDGWSMEILVRELAGLYREQVGGPPAALPELPVQYPDYAVWQRQRLDAARLAGWLDEARLGLAELPAALDLPLDRSRPRHLGSRGAGSPLVLGGALAAEVRAFARREASTPFMVLLAAWAVLLARLSGQPRFAVGTPVANRERPELEGLIGLFVNTLVLPIDVSGEPSFRTVVARVREVALAAHARQALPFERLVEALAPERDLGRTPLFQVMFSLENVRAEPLAAPGLAISPLPLPVVSAAFELTLALAESAAGWQGLLEWNTELFDAATVERWGRALVQLLQVGLARPELPVSRLAWLAADERRELLTAGGLAGPVEGGPVEGVPERLEVLVERVASLRPETVAVVGAGEHWSYGYLLARAAGVAHGVRELRLTGVSGGEAVVGLLSQSTPELLAGTLGAFLAGCAILPLDPSLPAERRTALLERAGARAVLCGPGVGLGSAAPGVAELRLEDIGAARAEGAPSPAPLGPEALAYVLFTSGSTGRPKGVMLEHRAVSSFIARACALYGLGVGSRVLQFASIGFDTSVEEIFATLASGATLVLRDPELLGAPARFFAAVAEQRITLLDLPTSWWHALVPALGTGEQGLPSSVATVVLGGERAQGGALARWWQAVGTRVTTWNTYGPTETTVFVTAARLSAPDRAGLEFEPPIGRPLPGTRAHVVDGQGEPVPWGVVGELWLGGCGLARGYLGAPGLTAESFLPDPLTAVPGSRLYRSGDLARLRPDGELEFVGRADRQLKVRGIRVEPGEIEAALLADPSVEQAVVLPWVGPDPGGAVDRLVAYLVPASGCALAEAPELRRRLRQQLPEALVPAAFVSLPALPLTRNGKLDQRALPAPAAADSIPTTAEASPATPLEEVLLELFAEVLGRSVPSRHASFFDLGGHSLLATRLVARVRTLLGFDLPLVALFETPTPAGLAGRLDGLMSTTPSVAEGIAVGPRPSRMPLSFAQEQLWFESQLEPDSADYHITDAVRVEGPLELGRLRAAFGLLASRHEALRTVFPAAEGEAEQKVWPSLRVRLPVVDLSSLEAGAGSASAQALAAAAVRRPFQLAAAPPWRALALRLGREEHVVALVLHHIVADGASVHLLVGELLKAYTTGAAGLGPPPFQFGDYALWQRRRLQGEELERLLRSGLDRLGRGFEELALPADRVGCEDEAARGGLMPFTLPLELASDLTSLARGEGATLYMALLAAFQVLLARYAGVEEITVGTYFGGRDRDELRGAVGLFVNTLVLRVDLGGDPSFREALSRVRSATLEAFFHRELPFAQLVERLRQEPGGQRGKPFQAAFNFDQQAPPNGPELPGLKLSPFPMRNPSAPVELILEIEALPTGLHGSLRYDARRYSVEAAERIVQHYCTLVVACHHFPDTSIFALPLEMADLEDATEETSA